MEYKMYGSVLALKIDRGEEILTCIKEVCETMNIKAGFITGLGAVDKIEICLYDVVEKKFHGSVIEKPMEMSSISGNVSEKGGEVYLHIHANFADASGAVIGGHLKEARVSGVAEIFITKLEGVIDRKFDEGIGLNVMVFR
ncbi:MAG: DNA-binding protein [Clostridiales bacterium]|nr:DNA-binding protein [Clostridiales bacterium]